MASINLKSRKSLAIILAIVAATIGVVSKLALTSGELLPGIDGAYYWVQVRSILDDFTLAFDDLPLVFWAQSLLALIVGDIPLGVRISDALLPAISAIPIYLMLRNSKSVWLPAVAILTTLLHPIQLYFFTGDFLKNSAAIPFVFFIGWILYNWENAPKKRSVIYLLLCLAVLALAHFGTLLMGLLIVFVWLLVHLRNKPLRFWMNSVAITIASAAAVLAGLAILVPARFERLIEFVSQPETVVANPAWQMMFGGRTDYPMTFAMFTGQLGALALAFWAWKIRKNLSDSQLSLVVSSLVAAFLLSSPLIGMEWANRLIAMSFVPLFIAAMIVWMASEKLAAKITIGALAIVTLVGSMVFALLGVKQPIITDAEYQDLLKVSDEFVFPENSVVVARHGIEFLIAWEMNTHVLQETSYADEDLSSYDSVFYLEGLTGMGAPGGAPTDMGGAPTDKGEMKPPSGGMKPPSGDGGKPPIGGAPGDKPEMGEAPGGQPQMGGDMKKFEIDGEEVYSNDSFTIKKVR